MATLYVKASGGDSTTIQGAVDLVPTNPTEAYVIEVEDGTYDEQVTITGKSTTSANTITIKSADEATVNCTYTSNSKVFELANDYVRLQGLEIYSLLPGGGSDGASVRMMSGNIIVEKCTFKSDLSGIKGHTDLYASGSASNLNSIIRNNIFKSKHNNGYQTAIRIRGYDMQIYNNTIYEPGARNSEAGALILISQPTSGDMNPYIRNNIIYNTASGSTVTFFGDLGATGTKYFDNNIWYAPNATTYIWEPFHSTEYNTYADFATNAPENNGSYEDPLLTDPNNGDFTLQANSPAIDSGYNTGLTDDFEGTSRPQNSIYDIGAFEYTEEEAGGSPILCWQLTGRYQTGRLFRLNGSGPHPTEFKIPSNVIKDSISLIDEGLPISRDKYNLI